MGTLNLCRCRITTMPGAAVLCCALLVLMTGCAASSGARLDWSKQVFDDFAAGRVLDAHVYYTTGLQNAPDAILGVSRDYVLVSDRWRERDMTPELLRRLVGGMDIEFGQAEAGLIGASVLGEDGERVGVWYSAVGVATVEMLGGNKVRINPPLTPMVDLLRDSNKS